LSKNGGGGIPTTYTHVNFTKEGYTRNIMWRRRVLITKTDLHQQVVQKRRIAFIL